MVKVKFRFEDSQLQEQVVEGYFKGESILDIAEDAKNLLPHKSKEELIIGLEKELLKFKSDVKIEC